MFPDGTIGATWTFGNAATAFADRGTGYNYFDGSSWGAAPTARIESVRVGWPSYCPMGENGEMVIAHNGSTGLVINKRATKGTGAWTQSVLTGVSVGGSTALLWPRAIVTNGDDIHIIALTDDGTYQGLTRAMLYYRSTDGGATWDKNAVILPGMTSADLQMNANFAGFGGDGYGWAGPHGDTIAFFVAENWTDSFVMKSFDNGETWTKVTVVDFPEFNEAAAVGVQFPTTDGFPACALDNQGNAHVVFGRYAVSDDDFSDDASSWYPYWDGLIYWNETMPVLDTTQLGNPDLMFENGNLISWTIDADGNDVIDYPDCPSGTFPFGLYYSSNSTMPQITIDENNNIFVLYSGLLEDQVNPYGNQGGTEVPEMFRHLYVLSKEAGQEAFCDPKDINGDHYYEECVFGSMAFGTDEDVHIIYQSDFEPGLAVRGDEDDYDVNTMYYVSFPTFVANKPLTSDVKVNVMPNPASEQVFIGLNIIGSTALSFDIINTQGVTVKHINEGTVSGFQNLPVNISDLAAGVYVVRVNVGNYSTTTKLVVR